MMRGDGVPPRLRVAAAGPENAVQVPRSLVNSHFRFDPPKDMPLFSVVGGLVRVAVRVPRSAW